MQTNAPATVDNELGIDDLGPLAWVLDELRKSLDGATKAIRRFVRDAELARGSDLAELDASQLRIARQQLHQAVGALEMVGLGAPAKLLRAMEALAQKFVLRPELCSDEAANKVERASFALSEYLEGVLKGKKASPVALFPQYRDVLELAGGDRVHPADLWPIEWRWVDATLPGAVAALHYEPALRARVDQAVLRVVRTGDRAAAGVMRDVSAGLAQAQTALEPRAFWKISAAFFEALAAGLCAPDLYVKRAASRILVQYTSLARGEQTVSDRLAQDYLFYCANAVPADPAQAPILAAVRAAYGLTAARHVDYDSAQFGRFDPAVLAQARKRIAAATETWSALAGGDTNRLKLALEQFNAVGESILKLHPESAELARALMRVVEATVRGGEPPGTAIAMEVATAVLYLEAAYDDLDPTDSHMAARSSRLAQRLAHVGAGGQPEVLESWIEDLYRRVSDRQTMGSVMEELRTTLNEAEKSLDQFFRNPADKMPLHEVPSQLAQMRGVFSVLGMDQASLAALRMRDSVEKILVDDIDVGSARTGIFEKLGNSLGAMGFLIDMLSYQRALAKKLFVYDEDLGEFKPTMGREKVAVEEVAAPAQARPAEPAVEPPVQAAPAPAVAPVAAPIPAAPAARIAPASPQPLTPPVAARVAVPAPLDEDDAELRDIFLEEAREVVQTGLAAAQALLGEPANLGEQTILRRAFHTLKGSSRMVGLAEFGEAAWSMEQLLNTWLAEQKPASSDLVGLSTEAMQGFGRWVEDIAHGADTPWIAQPFRQASDGLRLSNQRLPLSIPGAPEPVETSPAPVSVAAAPVAEPTAELAASPAAAPAPVEPEVPAMRSEPAPSVPEYQSDPETQAQPDFQSTQMFEAPDLSEPQAHPEFEATRTFDELVDVPPSAPAPLGLEEFDFTGLGAEAPAPVAALVSDEYAEAGPTEMPHADPVDDDLMHAAEDRAAAQAASDEQVKVIGSLHIAIPLYNVYLNEADEWSRRLSTEVGEWAMELHRPVGDSTVALAHSLGGSSATVGFSALSEIARALEQALQHVQLQGRGSAGQASVFVQAAEDIRRLLHQFAAGFLKVPDQNVLHALRSISESGFASTGGELTESVQGMSVQELEVEPISTAAMVEQAPSPEPAPEPPAVPVLVPVPVRAVAARAPVPGPDDAIDLVDALDADLFPIFEEEGQELLPQLGGALRQWCARPDNLGARVEALRVLHTLKGSARLAGAMRLGEMTHRVESQIEHLGTENLQTGELEPLLGRFDALASTFEGLRKLADQSPVLPEAAPSPVASQIESVPTVEAQVLPIAPAQPAAPAPVAAAAASTVITDRRAHGRAGNLGGASRSAANQSVRVRSQLLDRLLNQAGEVMITRSRLEARLNQLRASLGDLTGNLERLRHQLRDIEVQAESQMQSRLALAKDTAQGFDPLEFDRFTRVQELTRMMAESVNDVATVQRNLQRSVEGTEDDLIAQARQARELQRDLLRTRMVEFESISERLYGVVRQAAKDAGKQVKLEITGGSMEIDRGVLDRVAPAFEHLLRNAVAHGIEDAERRSAAGKPAAGNLSIDVQHESNDVSVEFRDDGAGLDLARIRDKAIASGMLTSTDPLSDAQAANLIFMPGFSTATRVTELSGRGIGMDVVRTEVNALGGRIETSTQAGAGTRFKLVLPLTTAVTQVVMLRCGELVVGVPANVVEIIRRVPAAEVEQAYASEVFRYADEDIPFYWSGALLQASVQSGEPPARHRAVAVFRSAGQRVAVHVDEVLGNQEVVVKNLGPQLSRLPGLTGMSVLASGAVVLIYNPVALAAVYGMQARALGKAAAAAGAAGHPVPAMAAGLLPAAAASALRAPLVLVVDDSITVRRVTQRLLKREGYRVALAADGLQALERLQDEKPAVVLSDIEMPRMDGFDLARNIRADAKLRDLPIIMITSRIAEKHREHARELGVDHYLGKPYPEDELIALVRLYCAEPIDS